VVLAVGPEGGLTPAEIAAAGAAGFALVTLGPLTLRTETVCAAVLGALLAGSGGPGTS
jgi:16S rRNA (uracil1498-N3)-methyltransferase